MTKKYAILGNGISHTMSPYIHSELFKLSGVTADYYTLDISPLDLSGSLNLFKSFDGFNVTMPHKETIIPLLNMLDISATTYNAVNCVKNKNGVLTGYSTDAYGFIKALEINGLFNLKNVLILGGGGAARTIAKELCDRNCNITLAVRSSSLKRALELKDWLNKSEQKVIITDLENIDGHFDLCVNATPVGMYPNTQGMPINKGALLKCDAVFDAVYNPEKTKLIKTAKTLNIKAVGGMAMLVYQAVKAHEHWYNASFYDGDIKQLIEKANLEMVRIFNEK